MQNRERKYALLLPVFFAIFYFVLAPRTVQWGDTGELVANAYRGHIAHPPGFPLFMSWQYLWTHLFPADSIFLRAVAGNIAISAALLALLCTWARKRISFRLAFLATMVVGSSAIYWRYTLLPDVFVLNALFVLAVGILFLRAKSNRDTYLLLATFGIGLSNHPTLVFLLPLILYALWNIRKEWKHAIGASIVGIALMLLIYSSLFLYRHDSIYAWGQITNGKELLFHILRMDYGVGQLRSGDLTGGNFGAHFVGFFKECWWLGAFLPLLFAARPSWRSPQMLMLASAVLYLVVFFALANIRPFGFGAEVMARFYLLPCILIVTAILALPVTNGAVDKISQGILFAVIALQLWLGQYQLRANTVIEDHAVNLLEQFSSSKACKVLMVDSDTVYNALNYSQSALQEHKDVVVVARGLLGQAWYRQKLQQAGIVIPVNPKDVGFDVEQLLLRPNLERCEFVFQDRFSNTEQYKITYLPIGRRVEAGSGIGFDDSSIARLQLRSTPGLCRVPQCYDPTKKVFAEYAYLPLSRGLVAFKNNNLPIAEYNFRIATQLVPYALPAWENLCLVLSSQRSSTTEACQRQREAIRAREFNYF
jgi:hypothetical protein